MRLVIIIFLTLFFIQCGLPNPYSFGNNANPPIKIESRSDNNNIYLKVFSYNQQEIRELIKGYNVFFAFSSNSSEIQKNIIYLDQINSLPSIKYVPETDEYSFDIELLNTFSYGNIISKTQTNIINNSPIESFKSYYFIITPVTQMEDLSTKKFFLIHKETTEFNQLNEIVPISTTFTHSNPNANIDISFSRVLGKNYISGGNNTSIQDMGYFDDFNGLKNAPPNGYASYPLYLKENHIYVYKNGNFYGKVFIRSINTNDIIIDFSYQGKENETEV